MPPRIEIGQFRPRHLERILEIERETFPEEAYTAEMFLDLYRECPDLFLVARLCRRIVGYIASCAGPEKAEIISIAVDRAHRNLGVGTALLERSLARLHECKVRKLQLMVRTTGAAAIRFYRRFGFRSIRRVPHYYQNGGDGLRMRKLL